MWLAVDDVMCDVVFKGKLTFQAQGEQHPSSRCTKQHESYFPTLAKNTIPYSAKLNLCSKSSKLGYPRNTDVKFIPPENQFTEIYSIELRLW